MSGHKTFEFSNLRFVSNHEGMKTKKLLVGIGVSILGLLVIAVAIFLVANASDTELEPQVAATLTLPPTSSDDELAARTLADIKVPTDKDPKLCASRSWCPRTEVLKSEVADYVDRNVPYLAAYKRVVELPYYRSDGTVNPVGREIFKFLKLTKLQRLEWNLRIARAPDAKTANAVIQEMKNLNRFLIASLVQPQTLIEAQVFFILIKANRNFLVEAARSEPQPISLLQDPDLKFVTAPISVLSFEKVAMSIRDQEARGLAAILKTPLTFEALGLGEADGNRSTLAPGLVTRVADAVVQKGFLINDTLNRQVAVLTKAVTNVENDVPQPATPKRVTSMSPRNFVGRNLVLIFSSQVEEGFYRIKQSIADLQKPISLEAP